MTEANCRIGMLGLGVMGRNLALNMAEHGFPVAGYDKDPQKGAMFRSEAEGLPVQEAGDVVGFVSLLQPPRAVILLVLAGPVVDNVIRDLLPALEPGDLVIDAGNSHFTDTDLRESTLATKGLHFIGMGVSGGEAGARHGPSMMPGGEAEIYPRVQDILEAAAAHVENAWEAIEPVLDAWGSVAPADFPNYPGGSWGPASAEALIAQDGRQWLQPKFLDQPKPGG